MTTDPAHVDLPREHLALIGHYARVQARCEALHAQQRARIAALEADITRLRGTLIARDTALTVARDDRAALEASLPGLPKRLALVRRVEALGQRVQSLLRERLQWQWQPAPQAVGLEPMDLQRKSVLWIGQGADDSAAFDASLRAADLVICQTGCISHDAYWRVQDHCKRTGKPCVLVDQPQALRFMPRTERDALAARD